MTQYRRKLKRLDKLFAAGVVGDGINDIAGPFEAAYGRFHRGGEYQYVQGGLEK